MSVKTKKHKVVPINQIESLKEKSLNAVVSNIAAGVLGDIPPSLMPEIVNRLPTDLPPSISLKLIHDETYWKSCCLKSLERYECRIEEHENSWKCLYFEKLITQRLESFDHENEDFADLLAFVDIVKTMIVNLTFHQLPTHLDISEVIGRLSNLATLDITYGFKNSGMSYERLLFGMKVGDASYLATALSEISTLHTLKLTENLIDDDILRVLMTGLLRNNSIKHLDLSHNQISNHGARLIAKLLGDSSILITLNLSDNHIQAEGAKFVARALREGGPLKVLNLRLNKLSDEGCRYILEGILDNTVLKSINLSCNGAEHKCAGALSNLLRQKTASLVDVDVANNYFNANHMEQFLSALRENTTLRYFDLRLNPGYISQSTEDQKVIASIQRIVQGTDLRMRQAERVGGNLTQTPLKDVVESK